MKKNMKKVFAMLMTLLVILAATACAAVGSNDSGTSGVVKNGDTVGEGAKTFSMEVVDGENNAITFTVKTDEKTVGGALQELQILEGEQGDYGLYIKAVNGITADYDKDGTYWAFYIDGEYAMTGVDMTDIAEGSSYALKVEKAE